MNDERIHQVIAEELGIRPAQVQASVQLLAEGNTIPFIARYRKDSRSDRRLWRSAPPDCRWRDPAVAPGFQVFRGSSSCGAAGARRSSRKPKPARRPLHLEIQRLNHLPLQERPSGHFLPNRGLVWSPDFYTRLADFLSASRALQASGRVSV